MTKKLSWEQIQEWYAGHWVELVDFEWEWDRPTPARAVVQHCSEDRSVLLSMSRTAENGKEGIIMYVGRSSSLVRPSFSSDAQPVTL